MKTKLQNKFLFILATLALVFASMFVFSQAPRADKTTAFAEDQTATITDVQVALSSGIVVKFITDGTTDDGNSLTVTFGGEQTTLTESENGVFRFYGVSPQMMGDTMTAVLKDSGGNTLYQLETPFSVKNYLETVLAYSYEQSGCVSVAQYKALRELCVDMLNYGAKAQIYKNHDIENLVNADLGELSSLATAATVKGTTNKTYAGNRWKGANVRFDSEFGVMFAFSATESEIAGLTVTVNDTVVPPAFDEDIGYYVVRYNGISVLDMNTGITAKISEAGKDDQTFTYGFSDYVAAKGGAGTAFSDLVDSAYKYGYAAVAYGKMTYLAPTFETDGYDKISDKKGFDFSGTDYDDVTLPSLNTTSAYTATVTSVGANPVTTFTLTENAAYAYTFESEGTGYVNIDGTNYTQYNTAYVKAVNSKLSLSYDEGFILNGADATVNVDNYYNTLTLVGTMTIDKSAYYWQNYDLIIGTEQTAGNITFNATANIGGHGLISLSTAATLNVVNGTLAFAGDEGTTSAAAIYTNKTVNTVTVSENGTLTVSDAYTNAFAKSSSASRSLVVNGTMNLAGNLFVETLTIGATAQMTVGGTLTYSSALTVPAGAQALVGALSGSDVTVESGARLNVNSALNLTNLTVGGGTIAVLGEEQTADGTETLACKGLTVDTTFAPAKSCDIFVNGGTLTTPAATVSVNTLTVDNGGTATFGAGLTLGYNSAVVDENAEYGYSGFDLTVPYGTVNVNGELLIVSALFGSESAATEGNLNLKVAGSDGLDLNHNIASRCIFAKGTCNLISSAVSGTAIDARSSAAKVIEIRSGYSFNVVNFGQIHWKPVNTTFDIDGDFKCTSIFANSGSSLQTMNVGSGAHVDIGGNLSINNLTVDGGTIAVLGNGQISDGTATLACKGLTINTTFTASSCDIFVNGGTMTTPAAALSIASLTVESDGTFTCGGALTMNKKTNPTVDASYEYGYKNFDLYVPYGTVNVNGLLMTTSILLGSADKQTEGNLNVTVASGNGIQTPAASRYIFGYGTCNVTSSATSGYAFYLDLKVFKYVDILPDYSLNITKFGNGFGTLSGGNTTNKSYIRIYKYADSENSPLTFDGTINHFSVGSSGTNKIWVGTRTVVLNEGYTKDGKTGDAYVYYAAADTNFAYADSPKSLSDFPFPDTTGSSTFLRWAPETDTDLTWMSFNIRQAGGSTGGDANKAWSIRGQYLIDNVLKHEPDVVCFQEVDQSQYYDLNAGLTGYTTVWYARQTGSDPEGLAVSFKADKYVLVSQSRYWLSETPDTQSYGWGESYYRIVVNVLLLDKNTGIKFNVSSVHMGLAKAAQVSEAELILSKMAESAYPTLLAGDFNLTPLTDENDDYVYPAYGTFTDALDDLRLNFANKDDFTFSAYNQTPESLIDFFMATKNYATATSYQVLYEKWDLDENGEVVYGSDYSHPLSDHYAIMCSLNLKRASV